METSSMPPSQFDLPAYISRYEGSSKLNRLLFISQTRPELQGNALRLLVNEIKKPGACNTAIYVMLNTMGVFQQLGPGYEYDNQWLSEVETRAAQRHEQLETTLQVEKTKMIKETIRLCLSDLGDFYSQRGIHNEAMKMYLRTREYCSSNKQVAEMGLKAVRASIDDKDFKSAKQNLLRVEPIVEQIATECKDLAEKCKLLFGIVLLQEGEFESAASRFVNIDGSFAQAFNDIASLEDIVLYGTLCSLASFSRASIKGLVIDNIAFKSLTELLPEVRNMPQYFCSGKYSELFSELDSLSGILAHDIYLRKHTEVILTAVKERCISQYITPYSVIDMRKMAESMQVDIPGLASIVAKMIAAGKVSAKIDMASCVIYRQKADGRKALREKMVDLGRSQIRDLKVILLRLSMMRHDFSLDTDSPTGCQPSLFTRAHDDLELAVPLMDLAEAGDEQLFEVINANS